MKQVVVSDYINSFVQNFLFGGFSVATLGLLIEYVKSGIAYSSYIYSALPVVYFFLFWITYRVHGEKGINLLNVHLIFGSIIFILFLMACHISNKAGVNYIVSLGIGSVVFVALSIFYFRFCVHKKIEY
tara:strand:- start:326 stop:712 length:387 start_codon:yes stop_codon:yes gene_type:complete